MAKTNVGTAVLDLELDSSKVTSQIKGLGSKMGAGQAGGSAGAIFAASFLGQVRSIPKAFAGINSALTSTRKNISKWSGQINGAVLSVAHRTSLTAGAWKKFANVVLGSLPSIGLVVAAITGLVMVLKKATAAIMNFLKASSEIEEMMNRSGAVFKKHQPAAEKWIKTIIKGQGFLRKGAGLGENEVRGLLNDMQAAFAPIFGREQATKHALAMAQRAVDIASFQDKSTAEAGSLMLSAIQRGGRAATSLGTAFSDQEVKQRLILKYGKDALKTDITRRKQAVRMQLILERSADAQNDFVKTASSMANQGKRLEGTWQNVKTIVGETITEVFGLEQGAEGVRAIVESIGSSIKLISPLLKAILTPIRGFFRFISWKLRVYNGVITGLADKMEGLANWFNKLMGKTPVDGLVDAFENVSGETDIIAKNMASVSSDIGSIFSNAQGIGEIEKVLGLKPAITPTSPYSTPESGKAGMLQFDPLWQDRDKLRQAAEASVMIQEKMLGEMQSGKTVGIFSDGRL